MMYEEEIGLMNLVNKEVAHNKWGEGLVIEHDGAIIGIKFSEATKKFVYPEAFEKHLVLCDKEDAAQFAEMISQKQEARQQKIDEENTIREEAQKKEHLRLQYERLALNHKLHQESQLVFWADDEERQTAFEEWNIFTGAMKSGQNKGKPNKAVRLHQNSAVVITARTGKLEKDRRVLGIYMAQEDFIGKLAEDGRVPAHKVYRLQLTEEESEQLYFWNYYKNHKSPEKISWNTGKYRYFENIWAAQILRDIYALKKTEVEKAEVKRFIDYFCKVNQLTFANIPAREGVLTTQA